MKKKLFLTYWAFFLLSHFSVFAQEEQRCREFVKGEGKVNSENDPLYYQFLDKIQRNDGRQEEDELIVIPLLFHIMHSGEQIGQATNISHEQIVSQVRVLNEDYSGQNPDRGNARPQFQKVAGRLNVLFVLAKLDSAGKFLAEEGVIRMKSEKYRWTSDEIEQEVMPKTIWDPTKYLNIWVFGDVALYYGFARFPDQSGLAGLRNSYGDPMSDGIALDHDAVGSYLYANVPQLQNPTRTTVNQGRTLTHEIGHTFGLLHTFEDGCLTGDYCDDTPPISSSTQRTCQLERLACQTGQLAMTENFMDYTPDRCLNIFTQQQVARMKTVLQKCPRRKELTSSFVVSLEKENFAEKVDIYPNPVEYELNIQFFDLTDKECKVFNNLGQQIYQEKAVDSLRIQTSLWADGLYILQIKTANSFFTKKIVVQK